MWAWFQELCGARPSGAALSHQELFAFFTLYRIRPDGWELDAIKALDRTWLVYQANKIKAERGIK